MEDIVKKIGVLLSGLSTENKLLALQKVQHVIVEQSEGSISGAKVNSGAKAELFACMEMQDLTWNAGENNGADAIDAEGRGVELKTFMYRQTKHCNAHITFPKRPRKMSDEDYREFVVEHFRTSPKYEGGLRMVAMTHNKSKTHHWYIIPRAMLPVIAEDHLKRFPKAEEYNPGGVPCGKCKLVHRMIQIQEKAKQGALLEGRPDKVCRALDTSQVAKDSTLPEIH